MGLPSKSLGSVIGNWKTVAASIQPPSSCSDQHARDVWRTVLLDLDMPECNTTVDLQNLEERRIPNDADYLPPKGSAKERRLLGILEKRGEHSFQKV